MCDPCASVLSCARENLLPLARKHLLPIALDHLLPILKEAVNMIRGVPNDKIAQMKKELESIEKFIHQEDKMADAGEINPNDETRGKIKELIEASFRIQDVIDEYIIREEQQLPDPGCAAVASDYVKTKMLRLQIAHDIHIIKSQINEMKDTSTKKDQGLQIKSSSSEQGSSSSGVSPNATSLQKHQKAPSYMEEEDVVDFEEPKKHDGSSSSAVNPNSTSLQNLRKAPFYTKEADVVGFEKPRNILVDWLVKGRDDLTVVSVVAMGGQGKTTLAKKVFDKVKGLFEYHVWITVSQSYNIEGLLRRLLKELCNQQQIHPPQSIHEMNQNSLEKAVRNYLQEKRYVIVFDDVWNSDFWDSIQFAMIDEKKSSRILITTRTKDVAIACRKSSFVQIHELKCLNDKQSLELFNKKAFHDLEECCPKNLIDISTKIVEKCNGLPLAIVVIGGVLSGKDRNIFEWNTFSKNLNSELNKNSMINIILGLSYHDLPYNLKLCLLYFGLYLDDYVIPSKILTRQWVAEGFIKEHGEKTLEEVANGYLTELIHKSLVQVVSFSIDGRAKSCRVHDLVHAMILKKCQDLRFCKNIREDKQPSLTGMVRRLSIASSSDNFMESIDDSQVRSLLVLTPKTLPQSFVGRIPTKYRRLKVLILEEEEFPKIPEDLGSLSYLKYFRFCGMFDGWSFPLPKSFGMLENLETLEICNLDIKQKTFSDLPKEICKLKKLRHLIGPNMSLIQMKDGIGDMTSLQTIRDVYLSWKVEDVNKVIELIKELGKLKQLRELVLEGVRSEYMSVLSSSINEMQHMEKLHISANGSKVVIDMNLNSPPLMIRTVKLYGKLMKFPKWISRLQNLAKLKLQLPYSKQREDVMKLLVSIPNLLSLNISSRDFEDRLERLHFKNGWFNNLMELYVECFYNMSYILIDEGALGSLIKLQLYHNLELKTLPTGIQHLKKLKDLRIFGPSNEFMQSIAPDEGKEHWIFKQVPFVKVYEGYKTDPKVEKDHLIKQARKKR